MNYARSTLNYVRTHSSVHPGEAGWAVLNAGAPSRQPYKILRAELKLSIMFILSLIDK
jgi:hypothetical protein